MEPCSKCMAERPVKANSWGAGGVTRADDRNQASVIQRVTWKARNGQQDARRAARFLDRAMCGAGAGRGGEGFQQKPVGIKERTGDDDIP